MLMNTRGLTLRRRVLGGALIGLAIVATSLLSVSAVQAGLTGRMLIAGYGPELHLFQDLGKAFERAHPGTAVDFEWDRNVKAAELVLAGAADLAVSDHSAPSLRETQIAWDGIAVIVNFANPIREITSRQLRDLFTGRLARWSDLGGSPAKVEVLERPPEDNIKAGFESSLDIADRVFTPAAVVRSDQKALRAVSGNTSAVTYLSLSAALKAQEDGIPIQILTVDTVEPGLPTVKDGSYTLRRPLYLLSREQPGPIVEAFLTFAQSAEAAAALKTAFVPARPPSREIKDLGLVNTTTPPAADKGS
ncbi:substrate-binding domain-containing protein [Nitrospira sp. Nam80]